MSVTEVPKEINHFHGNMVMGPKNIEEISFEENRTSLQYLMFLKQKRCGKIKGRGCADGIKQREYLNKGKTSAPTVVNESLMLVCLIDAMEHCH